MENWVITTNVGVIHSLIATTFITELFARLDASRFFMRSFTIVQFIITKYAIILDVMLRNLAIMIWVIAVIELAVFIVIFK